MLEGFLRADVGSTARPVDCITACERCVVHEESFSGKFVIEAVVDIRQYPMSR
jgi:hypothetical protein